MVRGGRRRHHLGQSRSQVEIEIPPDRAKPRKIAIRRQAHCQAYRRSPFLPRQFRLAPIPSCRHAKDANPPVSFLSFNPLKFNNSKKHSNSLIMTRTVGSQNQIFARFSLVSVCPHLTHSTSPFLTCHSKASPLPTPCSTTSSPHVPVHPLHTPQIPASTLPCSSQ